MRISPPYFLSDAASLWAGSSGNPITTREADYAHHITASPPGFENPAASLIDALMRTCKMLDLS